MNDRELISLCEAQIEAAKDDTVKADRAKAMDYYMGDMSEWLPHEEGRSGFVSRDVLDTVEWVLPSLMKICLDEENAVSFNAMGPEDEKQAEQETKVIRHVFFSQNEGFLILYSFFKDALLSKVGVVKSWFEDSEREREEYKGLNPLEAQKLLNDPAIKAEILEAERDVNDGINLVLSVQRNPGRIKSEPVPPEEFGVSAQCRTPRVKDAPFVYHVTRKTVSELIEAGYDRKLVEALPLEDDLYGSEEKIARHKDENTDLSTAHKSMRQIRVAECYIRLDRDDDGIAELLKVTLGGDPPGSSLLDVEEVDRINISTATPVVVTHRFNGMSLSDLVMDIQDIHSTLLRGMLDHVYLSNANRMGANERVNLDDLLISRAGGIVRTEGDTPPGENLFPIQHAPLPPEAFGMLEVLDKAVKNRTGVGDEVMGLDTSALANINTGVMIQAYEASRMRIEMMARLLGELGVKDIFKDIHALMCKNIDRPLHLKIDSEWVMADPRSWRTREDVSINVGIGHADKHRKVLANQDMLQSQMSTASMGGVVQPGNLYSTLAQKAKNYGLDPAIYFTDPSTLPPPPTPPPDPALVQAQASMMNVQVNARKVEVESERAKMDSQTKMLLSQAKEREVNIRAEMEKLKANILLRRQIVDEESQIMNASTAKDGKDADAYLRSREINNKQVSDMLDRQLDRYQSELSALTKFSTTVMQTDAARDEEINRLRDQVQQLRVGFERRNQASAAGNDGERGSGGQGTGDHSPPS